MDYEVARQDRDSTPRRILISLAIALAVFGLAFSCVFGIVHWWHTLPDRIYPESATIGRQHDLAASAFVNRDLLTPAVDVAWLEAHAPSLDSGGTVCPITLEWVESTPERKRGLLIADWSCIEGQTPRIFRAAFEIRTPTDGEATGYFVLTGDPSQPDWWDTPIEERSGVSRLHVTTRRDSP